MPAEIRLATEADADAVAAIYAPVVANTAISFETTPPAPEEMARRIRETTARLPWLVCEHDGSVVGYASASPHEARPAYQWSIDVSVYVHERWHRRNIGRGLYESLFETLRMQGFYDAIAVISLPNPASVGFHEALGFEHVGTYTQIGYKHGEWRDVGHWQFPLQPHADSPSPPTPIEDLRDERPLEETVAAGESVIQL